MRLAEAEAWLEGLINLERSPDLRRARLSLAPVQHLLARIGEPQRRLRVVHVAGSKGKGSTALLGEALLRAAGLSTGTFTSPHLERWTERFRIDAREVSGDALAAAITGLRPHVDALRDGPEPPSFFDVTTAAAFQRIGERLCSVRLRAAEETRDQRERGRPAVERHARADVRRGATHGAPCLARAARPSAS